MKNLVKLILFNINILILYYSAYIFFLFNEISKLLSMICQFPILLLTILEFYMKIHYKFEVIEENSTIKYYLSSFFFKIIFQFLIYILLSFNLKNKFIILKQKYYIIFLFFDNSYIFFKYCYSCCRIKKINKNNSENLLGNNNTIFSIYKIKYNIINKNKNKKFLYLFELITFILLLFNFIIKLIIEKLNYSYNEILLLLHLSIPLIYLIQFLYKIKKTYVLFENKYSICNYFLIIIFIFVLYCFNYIIFCDAENCEEYFTLILTEIFEFLLIIINYSFLILDYNINFIQTNNKNKLE